MDDQRFLPTASLEEPKKHPHPSEALTKAAVCLTDDSPINSPSAGE